ncbi:MAG: HAD family hydrolase [Prevotella sp.]|nr:HAD family hydrolase [Prevotella sp.]
MIDKERIRLLAFDADDTLWDCQSYFDEAEKEYTQVLSDYGSSETISESLFKTESANMELLGYGSKAFLLSLIENAVRISEGTLTAEQVGRIICLGKDLLNLPATPLAGVESTLSALRGRIHSYRMVVFTKGELLDQENKLNRSGLGPLFDDIVIVSDKTPAEYMKLCQRFGCDIGELMMVGNSFRSDIDPVLRLGGFAAHVPAQSLWLHEHAEEYEHERLVTLDTFAELADIV